MNYGWLNIGSILFGLIAVAIPAINIMRKEKVEIKKLGIFSSVSIGACSTSLCMQILYTNYLVNIEDFTAMMDLFGTVASFSVILLIITIVLNFITYTINLKIKTSI